jgi:hypothetical protein
VQRSYSISTRSSEGVASELTCKTSKVARLKPKGVYTFSSELKLRLGCTSVKATGTPFFIIVAWSIGLPAAPSRIGKDYSAAGSRLLLPVVYYLRC